MQKRWDYKNLVAWQVSMDLIDVIYTITKEFPKEELFWLSSQSRRAANSIALNIAEWNGRKTDKDYKHFLNTSYASSLEVESAAIIAFRQAYISRQQLKIIEEYIERIKKLIYGITKSLS